MFSSAEYKIDAQAKLTDVSAADEMKFPSQQTTNATA